MTDSPCDCDEFRVEDVARQVWIVEGMPQGRDVEFWLKAEEEICKWKELEEIRLQGIAERVEQESQRESVLEDWRKKHSPKKDLLNELNFSWKNKIVDGCWAIGGLFLVIVSLLFVFVVVPFLFLYGIDLIREGTELKRYIGTLIVIGVFWGLLRSNSGY